MVRLSQGTNDVSLRVGMLGLHGILKLRRPKDRDGLCDGFRLRHRARVEVRFSFSGAGLLLLWK